jgi:hypothetical protein
MRGVRGEVELGLTKGREGWVEGKRGEREGDNIFIFRYGIHAKPYVAHNIHSYTHTHIHTHLRTNTYKTHRHVLKTRARTH